MNDEELRIAGLHFDGECGEEGLGPEQERALLRAGRAGEVVRRYADRLRCAAPWSELARDPRSPRVRRCGRCGRSVALVRDLPELRRYVAAGRQVAGTPELLDAFLTEVVARLGQGERSPLPSCFAPAGPEDLAAAAAAEAAPWPPCGCLQGQPQATRFHEEVQDTGCDAWQRLLELIEAAARDGRHELRLPDELDEASWERIVTLPPTIAKLKQLRVLWLHRSRLVRLPPEIGELTSLRELDTYSSYRLHWYPYELTRCRDLARSAVSTRALYGNHKFRPPFPDLEQERGPVSGACSVCGGPAGAARQVWTSMQVATDVLPLLVNACSEECLGRLPPPAPGYFPRPHRGGRADRPAG